MLVTTSYDPSSHIESESKLVAELLGWKWVPRKRLSISALFVQYDDQQIIVFTEQNIKYYNGADEPVFFHPSSSTFRIKRLLRGEEDGMISASGVAPGDSVLDCTAGLASDAIVFSFVVGELGRVTALESEQIIYFLVHTGLRQYDSGIAELDEAMRRVRLEHADHLDYLQRQSEDSVDIVYFDPMFRQPISESSSINPMREVANHQPIRTEAIEQAKRVAKKAIVMKEHKNSPEFERLGFREIYPSQTKIAYGVIRL